MASNPFDIDPGMVLPRRRRNPFDVDVGDLSVGDVGPITPFDMALPEQPAPPPPKQTAFGEGLSAGILQTQALGQAAAGITGVAIGAEDFAEDRFLEYDRLMNEAAQYQGLGIQEGLESPGKFLSYAAGVLGRNVPTLATIAVTGGAGAILGQLASRGLLAKGTEATAAKLLMSIGAQRGAAAGAFAGAATLETGGIAGEQREAGVEPQPGPAFIGGAAAGSLELVPWVALAGAFGLGPLASASLRETLSGMGLLKRMGTLGGITAASEATTEALQEGIAIAARKFVDENYEVLGPEAGLRIMEAAAAGSIVGGLFGGIGGAVTPSVVRDEVEAVQQGDPTRTDPRPVMPDPGEPGSTDGAVVGVVDGPIALLPPPPGPIPETPTAPAPTVPVATTQVEDYASGMMTLRDGRRVRLVEGLSVRNEGFDGDYLVEDQVGDRVVYQARVEPLAGETQEQAVLDELYNEQPFLFEETTGPLAPRRRGNMPEGMYFHLRQLDGEGNYRIVDPTEQIARDLSREPEDMNTSDYLSAMDYDLPGIAGTSINSTAMQNNPGAGMEQAAESFMATYNAEVTPVRDEFGRLTETWTQQLIRWLAHERQAIVEGLSDNNWQDIIEDLRGRGFLVRPNPVTTPSVGNLPMAGTLSRSTLEGRFQNGSGQERSILGEVLRDMNVAEEPESPVDMAAFWRGYRQRIPELQLLRFPQDAAVEGDVGGFQLEPSYGLSLLRPDLNSDAHRWYQEAFQRAESWVFRNPLHHWEPGEHYPGIEGYFGHARVVPSEDGKELRILEIQDDYSQTEGGNRADIQSAAKEVADGERTIAAWNDRKLNLISELVTAEEKFGPVGPSGELLGAQQELETLREERDTGSIARRAELQQWQRTYERQQEELIQVDEMLHNLNLELRSERDRLENFSRPIAFQETHSDRSHKVRWLASEILAYAQKLGFERVVFPNPGAHSYMQMWLSGELFEMRKTTRWQEGPLNELETEEMQGHIDRLQRRFEEQVVGPIHEALEAERTEGFRVPPAMTAAVRNFHTKELKEISQLVRMGWTGEKSGYKKASKQPRDWWKAWAWVKLQDKFSKYSTLQRDFARFGADPFRTLNLMQRATEDAYLFEPLWERHKAMNNWLSKEFDTKTVKIEGFADGVDFLEVTLPEDSIAGFEILSTTRPGQVGVQFQTASDLMNEDITLTLGRHCE